MSKDTEKGNYHWFYGVGRKSDIANGRLKLGETGDPYERRNGYRTASMPEDPSSFLFLIKIHKQKKKVLKKIEDGWISMFQDNSNQTASNDTNVLYSIETIKFKNIFELISGFQKVLSDLQLQGAFVSVFLSDKEIKSVFDEYERLHDDDSSDSDISIILTPPSSGWELRAYQEEDISNAVMRFQAGERRLYLDIACGLGKTLMGYEILLRLGERYNVIVTSRGKLVKQFCNDIVNSWNFPSDDVFTCCSEGVPNIANVNSFSELRTKSRPNKQCILVTTYESFIKMRGGDFGFTLYDEAHHLVMSTPVYDISGNVPRNQMTLYDDFILIKCRLAVTATIKDVTYADLSGATPLRTNVGFSHQPELFGQCVSKRDYLFGKNNDFLVPFTAVGCRINDDALKDTLVRLRNAFGFTKDTLDSLEELLDNFTNGDVNLALMEQNDHDTKITRSLQLWYAIVADCIINACEKFGTKRAITYHTSIKRAETFSNIFNILIKNYGLAGKFSSKSVSSKNGGELNDEHLADFASKIGSEIKVLSNCRSLIEGFDEKSVDLTVFIDNKYSPLECNQIVGRGNRKDKTNPDKIHYVFIPFLCAESEAKARLEASNDYNLPRYILKNVLENTDPNAKVSQTVWIPTKNKPAGINDTANKPSNEIIYADPKVATIHDRLIAEKVTAVKTEELSSMHFNAARLWAHELAKELKWEPESEKNTESEIQKRWSIYADSFDLPENIPYNPNVIYREVGWFNWADYFGLVLKKNWREADERDVKFLLGNGLSIGVVTLTLLRKFAEDKISKKIPDVFLIKYKTSIYDIANKYNPQNKSRQHYITVWGDRQGINGKLKKLLKEKGIKNSIMFEQQWLALHNSEPDIPGIPTEVWDDFWLTF